MYYFTLVLLLNVYVCFHLIYTYPVLLLLFQTVNKVLIAYADVVKEDFEKYTNDHKKVSSFGQVVSGMDYTYTKLSSYKEIRYTIIIAHLICMYM